MTAKPKLSPALCWSEDGVVGCDLPGHAPYRGSDTWRRERWKTITPKVAAEIIRQDGKMVECECCRAAREHAQQRDDARADGGAL